MADGQVKSANCNAAGSTVVVQESEQHTAQPNMILKLHKPKSKKKVAWSSDTVDNEHMNKKKSKCCCIYRKPHEFGESSSDSETECDNCKGHVEGKALKSKPLSSDEEHPLLSIDSSHS